MPVSSRISSLIGLGLLFLIIGTGLWWTTTTSSPTPAGPSNQETPQIAATIFPLYDIATHLTTGTPIETTLILPAGSSPHTFDPSPRLSAELQQASVLYTIGHGADDWVSSLGATTGLEEVTVDKNIELRESADDHEDNANGNASADPHYWLTVENAKQITQTTAEDLQARFPEHQDTIQNNTADYLVALDEADEEIRTTLSSLPSRNIITFHDAWYYYADAYDLNIVGTFEPTAGREPSPQYLANLVGKMQEAGVTTIYTEPQFSPASLEAFLKDYGLKVATLDPLGGTEQTPSYIDLMLSNALTIKNNQ